MKLTQPKSQITNRQQYQKLIDLINWDIKQWTAKVRYEMMLDEKELKNKYGW